MSHRVASLLFLSVLVLACHTASSQCPKAQDQSTPQDEGTLSGTVVDPAEAPINAFMVVHFDGDNRTCVQISLSSDGAFELKLAPGRYDVFVAYPAFSPIVKMIEIKKGKTTHLTLKMRFDKHVKFVE